MNQPDLPIFAKLKEKSDFFCPRKWNELVLYLNHGNSNSCSLPPPHEIPEELLDDPFVLHNTPHKLKMQQLMLDGHRPNECYTCWQVEDLNSKAISDRLILSSKWEQDIPNLKIDPHHIPKYVELVFDNVCNFMCSYCDAGQSSTWATKIKKQSFFLKTDKQFKFSKIWIKPGSIKPKYHEAFRSWWPMIRHKVQELRITGGEPFLSNNFWNFLDEIKSNSAHLQLTVNTNLDSDQKKLQKFLDATKEFKEVHIAASLDAIGPMAEYTRQGLDFDRFTQNVDYVNSYGNTNLKFYLQITTNIFSIWGILDVLDYNISLRKKYKEQIMPFFHVIVRSPEFQDLSILPKNIKDNIAKQLTVWLDKNQQNLINPESDLITKLIEFLKNEEVEVLKHSKEMLKKDLVKFISYYENDSKHKLDTVFTSEFKDWLAA